MDWSLKPHSAASATTCTDLWDVEKHKVVDRITSLPIELLVRILSLLPTKDAAAISVLSWTLRRVFPLITTLDFDVSPISLCVNRPYGIERYSTFVAFVNNVLQTYRSKYLTRFRLKVGSATFRSKYYETFGCFPGGCCKPDCLPDLKSLHISAWISFPLTLCGLRELDLCILVREPGDAQLPPAIFTCQTLEVLKLEVNIGLHQVLAMPSYCLPNLKLFFFSVSFISDDGFLPRLLASCPLLEDLKYQAFTEHVHHVTIQSTSLRRLCLRMHKPHGFETDNSDFVFIDTPNLEHLEYIDNLACQYSIPKMHCLVRAKLCISEILHFEEIETSLQLLMNLITRVSHVQHLSLSGCFVQEFDYADVNNLKDQLPVFPKMKHLSLAGSGLTNFWHNLLLPLLNCSPVLQTLVFRDGVTTYYDYVYVYRGKQRELERKFFKTAHPEPSCCRHHLKTLVIKNYFGTSREEEFVQFFLRHALVLENLIIHCFHEPHHPSMDRMLIESTLRSLPKASLGCSIQVL